MARPQKVRELTPRLGRVVQRFWPYTRNYRLLMGGSLLALIAEVCLRLLEPWMLALVLDYVIARPEGGPPKLAVISSLEPTTLLAVAAVGLVLTVGLRALTVYVSTVGFALIDNRVLTQIRGDLYRHMHNLSLSFHTRARGGD